MENIIITTEAESQPKKLYITDNKDYDYDWRGGLLEDYLADYNYAYIGERKSVEGSKKSLEYILETLIEDENRGYFTEYTEEEIFDEVADDWDGLADYLFSRSGEKIGGEAVKRAFDWVKKEKIEKLEREALAEFMAILLGVKVFYWKSRGYSQGDYYEAFVILDKEEYLEAWGSLFNAWAFGCYSVIEAIDEEGNPVADANVLDFTPEAIKSLDWEARQKAIEEAFLKEAGLADYIGKTGKAHARKYTAWHYDLED